MGLGTVDVQALRRAGHLHDIGRLGVSNQVWSRAGDLSSSEWERVRMHPCLTERVLDRIPGLGTVCQVARPHHEHLDGTGYPLGLVGSALGRSQRILAGAVAYQSGVEPRPYRDEMSPGQARDRLRRRSRSGALEPECVEAVLARQDTGPPDSVATICSPRVSVRCSDSWPAATRTGGSRSVSS